MILDTAARHPNDIALDDLTHQRTWATLIDRATRVARFLRTRVGLAPDDHIALLMENRVEFIELAWGALLAGVWLTPINHHLQEDEIAYVIEDSGARLLFTDRTHEAAARRAGARVVVAGQELDRLLLDASDEPMPLTGSAGGTMFYTSGTTGRPKGVKRARVPQLGTALTAMGAAGATLGLDGSGPHLVTGPLYHAAPLLFAMYDQANGASLVIMPRWDDAHTLELLADKAIQHTHLVPTMFVRLLRLPEARRQGFDPSRLRLVLHGAAPIAPTVKQDMIDWWGPVLVEYWGATESGVCTLVDSAAWLDHPGTVGRPVPTFDVFTVDDDGHRLPPGADGALYCRHRHRPDVFEYHRAPEKTAAAYLEPGVFTLGDVGHVDADGYVYLSDRRSNMIVSGGVNIYPAEVERALQQHPTVADVAVFGIPDDEWGESVKAAVELMEGVAASRELEADILAFGRRHLAHYKVPRSIDFEERLPRHPTGKLHVRMLREPYWKGRTRQI